MTCDTIHFLQKEVRIFSIESKGKTRFTESPCFQTLIRNLNLRSKISQYLFSFSIHKITNQILRIKRVFFWQKSKLYFHKYKHNGLCILLIMWFICIILNGFFF